MTSPSASTGRDKSDPATHPIYWLSKHPAFALLLAALFALLVWLTPGTVEDVQRQTNRPTPAPTASTT